MPYTALVLPDKTNPSEPDKEASVRIPESVEAMMRLARWADAYPMQELQGIDIHVTVPISEARMVRSFLRNVLHYTLGVDDDTMPDIFKIPKKEDKS